MMVTLVHYDGLLLRLNSRLDDGLLDRGPPLERILRKDDGLVVAIPPSGKVRRGDEEVVLGRNRGGGRGGGPVRGLDRFIKARQSGRHFVPAADDVAHHRRG